MFLGLGQLLLKRFDLKIFHVKFSSSSCRVYSHYLSLQLSHLFNQQWNLHIFYLFQWFKPKDTFFLHLLKCNHFLLHICQDELYISRSTRYWIQTVKIDSHLFFKLFKLLLISATLNQILNIINSFLDLLIQNS